MCHKPLFFKDEEGQILNLLTSKLLGYFDAETEAEATELASKSKAFKDSLRLCPECARINQIQDYEYVGIEAKKIKQNATERYQVHVIYRIAMHVNPAKDESLIFVDFQACDRCTKKYAN